MTQTETVDTEQTEDTVFVDCKICGGTGEVIEDGTAEKCSTCQGSGKAWADDESDHDIETESTTMDVMREFTTDDFIDMTGELAEAHNVLSGCQGSVDHFTAQLKAAKENAKLAEEVQSGIIDRITAGRSKQNRPVIITKNYTTGRVTVTDEVTLEIYEEREIEPEERNPQKDLDIPLEPEPDDVRCPHCEDGFVVAADGTKMTCSACGGTGTAQEAPEAPVEPEADDQPPWCDGDALRLGQ